MDQNLVFTRKEIAEALGVAKTTILRRAEKEAWPYDNGKNRQRRYKLERLPADVQKALAYKVDVPAHLLPALAPTAALVAARRMAPESPFNIGIASGVPAWTPDISKDTLQDPRVSRLVQMVQEAQAVPKGMGKREWVEAVSVKYDCGVRTVYRYLKRYQKKGLSGLVHTKATKDQPKAWTPEAVDYWVGLCLKKAHRKVSRDVLYEILVQEARKRGWKVGSYRSANWWYRKKVTPQLLALQRGGNRALDNKLPPVLRDYSDLKPFEILVGDQHRFDLISGAELLRPH